MLRKILKKLKTIIFPSEFDLAIKKWRLSNGDKKLRQVFPLDSSSLVVDVGGYEGQWTSDIFSRYRCKILVFEPVKEFAEEIKDRFKTNDQIVVYSFGLAGKTQECNLSIAGDASSTNTKGSDVVKAELVDVCEFIQRSQIKKIDLIKINIEGGEYELLERLIGENLLPIFRRILVQFHSIDSGSEERMKNIQLGLGRTHKLKWQFKFVWELWESQ